MRRGKTARLSAGDMELMRMLWEHGPLTLAQAHQLFQSYGRVIAYPTMQTRLNRLVGKGYAARNDERPATYRAAISRESTAASVLGQMLDKVFGGNVAPLVSSLISERPLTDEEIRDIRKLLDEAERATESKTKRRR